ncbi:MAG: hypothetical protein GWP19_02095 [Planctomycetia bacterium]|nr:hypothetical protein [Planctomycetia bacterium]
MLMNNNPKYRPGLNKSTEATRQIAHPSIKTQFWQWQKLNSNNIPIIGINKMVKVPLQCDTSGIY